MKIAVLGGGNMGGAIAAGLVEKGVAQAGDITVSHPKAGLEALFTGMRLTRSNAEAVAGADLVILAVKPWLAGQVAGEIAPALRASGAALASIVAGVRFDTLAQWMASSRVPLLRIIPNTAVALGCSVTFIAQRGADDALRERVRELFAALGAVYEVEEEQMGVCTALSSCGIAYALRYLGAAADAGAALGVEPAQALRIVRQTMQGALALLEREGSTPQAEIDKVTTPGGITLRGLEAMEREGFSRAVAAGLEASK